MNSSLSPKDIEKICPFLGISSDSQTAMAYPSTQNYCSHVTPSAAPGTDYQREVCLKSAHIQCQLYAAKSAKRMPTEFLADELDKPRKHTPALRWLILGLTLLAVIAAAIWTVLSGALVAAPIVQPSNRTASAAASVTQANATFTWTPPPSPTARPSSTHTPQPSPTAKHSVTSTPTPTPQFPHLLETPIGSVRQFLVHRMLDGEGLIYLADKYHTSMEAIRAVNFNIPSSLWVNSVLVIPLNQLDVAGVAPMTAYAISSDGITVKTLALAQGIKLDVLCTLNDLPSNYLFHTGEWVILPHIPPTP